MKKRILSMILVSVMLLLMIPTLAVGANPAVSETFDYNNYRTVVTQDTINVDGELDEVYKNSQKITGGYWLGTKSSVDFAAYTALTLRGLYVWAEIKDNTLDKSETTSVSEADRFQIYIKMSDGRDLSWGWYETDYNGNVNKHSIMNADDIEGNYESYWDCKYSTKELSTPEVSTVKLPDGSGWRSEIFIPFSVELLNFTTYKLSVGFQVQNSVRGKSDYGIAFDRSNVQDAWYRYDCLKPIALVKYVDRSPSNAPNYVYNMEDIFTMDDVPLYSELINTAVYKQGSKFNIDGKKDAHYSEHNKIPLITWITYVDSTGTHIAPETSDMGWVYTAFDDENLYVYYERYDEELFSSEQLETLYYFEDESGNVISGLIKVELDWPWAGTAGGEVDGWVGTKIPESDITYQRATLGTNLYGAEYKMDLPEGIKAMLAAGKDVTFKLAFHTTQDTTLNGSKKLVNLSSSYPEAYREYDFNLLKGSFLDATNYGTKMILSKSFTEDKYGKIEGANLQLGSDITVNYYATIGTGDISNTYMKFTCNAKEYIAYPRKIAGSTQYKFAFTGIAPQNIGDNIKAELYIDGELVSTKDDYSVRKNCINLLSDRTYDSDVKLNNLVRSLLNYGAAAQKYVNYNTDNLVNKDYKVVLLTPSESDSVRQTGTKISDDLRMTAAGVYFDNDNKIYVKFKATSLTGVTVTMNDVPSTIYKVEGEENVYIAYSDSIPVTQFSIPYKIVLSNGSESQTAVYSVNSYAYAKCESQNEKVSMLAKATYTYGDAAKKYAGVGDAVYTVMSYNDADNNSPYIDNYANVMKIINDCNPDLVGMQEIQQSHVTAYYLKTNLKNLGNGCYTGENGDYAGVFYHSTPAEPIRSDYPDTDEGEALYKRKLNAYNGEVNKPSGDMIFYRKDKFEIVKDANGAEVMGRFWLSETPDVASILPTTEYTQCVMYVLLRDKATGNEILFINLHASYLSANERQLEILMELFEKGGAKNSYVQHAGLDMTSYRKIYTADWNCGRTSKGYAVMVKNGYTTTENLLGNVYKPATTVGGGFIDFCFVKGSEFKPLKYKVINDHPLSLTTSDHYPVFSKIAWAESYADVWLEEDKNGYPVPPENPTYNDYDDFFFTEDDTEDFVYGED